MPEKLSMKELRPMIGGDALDVDDSKVGDIEGVFVDKDTREPEWISLKSGGLLGSKHVVVPLAGAVKTEKGLRIPYPKDQIKDAPDVGGEEISQDEEARIYNHFGLQYSKQPSTSGLPGGAGQQGSGMRETSPAERSDEPRRQGSGTGETVGAQPSDADTDRARSEEGHSGRDAGQVRLRKYVETEVRRERIEEEK